jgi:hypothetical protein
LCEDAIEICEENLHFKQCPVYSFKLINSILCQLDERGQIRFAKFMVDICSARYNYIFPGNIVKTFFGVMKHGVMAVPGTIYDIVETGIFSDIYEVSWPESSLNDSDIQSVSDLHVRRILINYLGERQPFQSTVLKSCKIPTILEPIMTR